MNPFGACRALNVQVSSQNCSSCSVPPNFPRLSSLPVGFSSDRPRTLVADRIGTTTPVRVGCHLRQRAFKPPNLRPVEWARRPSRVPPRQRGQSFGTLDIPDPFAPNSVAVNSMEPPAVRFCRPSISYRPMGFLGGQEL